MSDKSVTPAHTSALWLRVVGVLCRLVLTVTFIFSGFVKAVDPLGTQYKIEDYLTAMGLGGILPDIVPLLMSVALAALEFCLGIFLLFAIRRRLTTRLVLAMTSYCWHVPFSWRGNRAICSALSVGATSG